jgi:hypothetical protein
MMEPELEEEGEEEEEEEEDDAMGGEQEESDEDEDEYVDAGTRSGDAPAGDESSLSSLSGDDDDDDPTQRQRRRRRSSRGSPTALRADTTTAAPLGRLTRDQRDFVNRMWEMMFEGSVLERGQRLLGRDQVKRWAGVMGEVWTDDEVRAFFRRRLSRAARALG